MRKINLWAMMPTVVKWLAYNYYRMQVNNPSAHMKWLISFYDGEDPANIPSIKKGSVLESVMQTAYEKYQHYQHMYNMLAEMLMAEEKTVFRTATA